VLARLNQVEGVQGSSASVGNPEGALVRVSVRPGADPAKTAAEVQRVLNEAVQDRSPVQLPGPAAAAALRQKEWLDSRQLADLAATGSGTSEDGAPILLAVLLLAGLVAGIALLGWRLLRRRRAGLSRPRARLSGSP
jgi:hypothetical protein